jgi:hypothetical protein
LEQRGKLYVEICPVWEFKIGEITAEIVHQHLNKLLLKRLSSSQVTTAKATLKKIENRKRTALYSMIRSRIRKTSPSPSYQPSD